VVVSWASRWSGPAERVAVERGLSCSDSDWFFESLGDSVAEAVMEIWRRQRKILFRAKEKGRQEFFEEEEEAEEKKNVRFPSDW